MCKCYTLNLGYVRMLVSFKLLTLSSTNAYECNSIFLAIINNSKNSTDEQWNVG